MPHPKVSKSNNHFQPYDLSRRPLHERGKRYAGTLGSYAVRTNVGGSYGLHALTDTTLGKDLIFNSPPSSGNVGVPLPAGGSATSDCQLRCEGGATSGHYTADHTNEITWSSNGLGIQVSAFPFGTGICNTADNGTPGIGATISVNDFEQICRDFYNYQVANAPTTQPPTTQATTQATTNAPTLPPTNRTVPEASSNTPSPSKTYQFTSTPQSDARLTSFLKTLRASESSQVYAQIQSSIVAQDIKTTAVAGTPSANIAKGTVQGLLQATNTPHQISGGEGFGIGFGATAGALTAYTTGVGFILLAYFKGKQLIGWVVERVTPTVAPEPVTKSEPVTESQVELAQLNATQEPYDSLEFVPVQV